MVLKGGVKNPPEREKGGPIKPGRRDEKRGTRAKAFVRHGRQRSSDQRFLNSNRQKQKKKQRGVGLNTKTLQQMELRKKMPGEVDHQNPLLNEKKERTRSNGEHWGGCPITKSILGTREKQPQLAG